MKKTVVAIFILLLVVSTSILASEEIIVPFSEIKQACYSEIDMSKAELALSEVGTDCVSEEWLAKNEIKTDKFEETVSGLDTPKKLVEYMEENFDHWKNREDITSHEYRPYLPEEFFRVEVGTCSNFAIFASYVLDQQGYEVDMLYYRAASLSDEDVGYVHGETFPHTITIFQDKDTNDLYYITNVVDDYGETGFEIFGPFTSKDSIVSREETRLSGHGDSVEVFLRDTKIAGSIGEELSPRSFSQAAEVLNTPIRIGNYIARNFDFDLTGGAFQRPAELFRSEKGNWYEFAVFISDLLDKNDYETEMLRLDFTIDGEKWRGSKPIGEHDLIVIYRDNDGRLRSINQSAEAVTRISQPYDSLEDLIHHQEKQRTLFPHTDGEIRIYRYARLDPGITDLKPDSWELRFEP